MMKSTLALMLPFMLPVLASAHSDHAHNGPTNPFVFEGERTDHKVHWETPKIADRTVDLNDFSLIKNPGAAGHALNTIVGPVTGGWRGLIISADHINRHKKNAQAAIDRGDTREAWRNGLSVFPGGILDIMINVGAGVIGTTGFNAWHAFGDAMDGRLGLKSETKPAVPVPAR